MELSRAEALFGFKVAVRSVSGIAVVSPSHRRCKCISRVPALPLAARIPEAGVVCRWSPQNATIIATGGLYSRQREGKILKEREKVDGEETRFSLSLSLSLYLYLSFPLGVRSRTMPPVVIALPRMY